MNHIRFLRHTHENGRHRQFPPEAEAFWWQQGGLVGHMLRHELPMTLAEITAECQCYQREYSEEVPEKEVDEQHVAWCLVKLAEWGMARIVTVKS